MRPEATRYNPPPVQRAWQLVEHLHDSQNLLEELMIEEVLGNLHISFAGWFIEGLSRFLGCWLEQNGAKLGQDVDAGSQPRKWLLSVGILRCAR
jgi:hypothetical protein